MVNEIFDGVDLKKFKEWLKDATGRSLWGPEFFIKMGFPEDLVADCTQVHKSQPDDFKETIIHEGGVVKEVEAVQDLDFLRELCHSLPECNCSRGDAPRGRGRAANGYKEAILEWLEKCP
jgi:hypothetical protein